MTRGAAAVAAVAFVVGCAVGPSAAEPGSAPESATVPGPPESVTAAEPGSPAGPVPRTGGADGAPGAGAPADAVSKRVPSDPTAPADAVERIIDLSHKAERANQTVLAGREDVGDALDARQEARARADAAREAVDRAEARVAQYRKTADRVAAANYQGARVNRVYALVLSDSPQQLIDQMSVLDEVTYQTEQKLSAFRAAVADAKQARSDAAGAADAATQAARKAQAAQDELVARQQTLSDRIDHVRELYGQMTGSARARLVGSLIPDGFDIDGIDGSGPGFAALQVALTRIGDPYVWGATGPDGFDCSGLVQWAYAQVGMSLPRTSQQQARGGTAVDPDDMQPGDVVTFYGDASHVGIYAGDGMMVHASTFGVPVKIQSVHAFPIHDVRRY